MGGIIGKVTDAVGLTNHKAEEAAAKAAGFANAQAYALTKEQIALQKEELQFQKDQYTDWKNIYGDVQKNLGDYYKALDGTKITALGLEAQQKEYQSAVQLMEREAAQRGISGSGIEYAAKSAATFQNAEARARIRADANKKAAEEKLGFLGVGLGQGTNMLGTIAAQSSNVNQAYTTGVNSRTAIAGGYLSNQASIGNSNREQMGSVIGAGVRYLMA